jgi:hypothetical protein
VSLTVATPLAAERDIPKPSGLAALAAPVTPSTDRSLDVGRATAPHRAGAVGTPPSGPTTDLVMSERPAARWAQAPELVVLMSVMRYHTGSGVEYAATSEVLTDAEADELIADLTEALTLLTNGRFNSFKAVHRQTVMAGSTARIVRSGQIVVGRYEGIRALRQTIGYGGRVPARGNDISSAAVLLDNEYDRSSNQRRLLRIHELGHALGYDHVDSQPSIMNARIGTQPTEFDRQMARAWGETSLTSPLGR